jgi:uncharacterized protein (TIGR02284 family)
MSNTDTTSVLNNLIETLKDGEEGFRHAAEELQSPELKSVATEFSQQRAQFAGQLQSLAKSLGESSPATGGSISGAVHRGWINLKSAISSHDNHAIMAEAERGEDIAVAAYRKALEAELPSNVRMVVQEQSTSVKAAHDRVKTLRDQLVSK